MWGYLKRSKELLYHLSNFGIKVFIIIIIIIIISNTGST